MLSTTYSGYPKKLAAIEQAVPGSIALGPVSLNIDGRVTGWRGSRHAASL